MNDKFTTWLDRELKDQGWSDRELGRRSGLTGAAISAVKAGVRKPGWDLVAAIAEALGKPPLELFRLAGLLPEESCGQDEPALLHHYRQLSPSNQAAALAMLRGLAGQPASAQTAPAPGADVDNVCRLLARLDSDRLELAALFIRWLVEQPGRGEPEAKKVAWGDVEQELANLPNEKEKTVVLNVLRYHARQLGYELRALGDTDSESDQAPHPGLSQGSLF